MVHRAGRREERLPAPGLVPIMAPVHPDRNPSMPPAVVIPTYNEADNIGPLLDQLLALPEGLSVVVVDDDSPDGTARLVEQRAQGGRVVLVQRPAKLGLGTAHLAGFARARQLGFDPVLTMDADFSHHPRDVPALLRAAEHADLVIGSRYVPGGGTRNCPLGRRLLSRTANRVARTALGLRAADATAGFRCYRLALVERLLGMHIAANGYSFLVEVLFRTQRLGCTVAEVPILFADREHGVSKISKQEVWRAMATVLRLARQRASRRGH